MEVEDVQAWQTLEVFNLLDLVLAENQNSKVLHRRNLVDFGQLVLGKVEEGQIRQAHEVVYFGDLIQLEVEEFEFLFAF